LTSVKIFFFSFYEFNFEHCHFLATKMTTTVSTTSLGEIRGKVEDGVAQYLGVKYATLENRFAEAELVVSREGDILDATKNG
jgi:hypothetical protein